LQTRLARHRAEFSLSHLGRDLAKIAVASAAMGVAVWGGWRWWSAAGEVSRANDGAGLVLGVGLGVGLYAGLLWLLRIEGRAEIAALLAQARNELWRRRV
jgi:putative peptidoglycan lipid II flippase